MGVFYVHADHLNTPRKLIEPSNNTTVWRWDSDAFGNGTPDQDPDGNSLQVIYNLRFPGQVYDHVTGLDYNYFDPSTGRYVESDPIGLEGGLNTYGYVGGNPVLMIDPLGLERITTFMNLRTTVLYDDNGNAIRSWPSRTDVVRSSLPCADCPYESANVYPKDGPHRGKPRAYGPNDILFTDDPRGRWLHGGGTGLQDPLAARQGWKPTLGCTRMQNQDIQELVDLVRLIRAERPNAVIPYSRVNYVRPTIVPFFSP